MIVKLELNGDKAKQYNRRIRELKVEHPDLYWKEVEKIEDTFCSYPHILRDKAWAKYKPVEKDNRPMVELKNIYVCRMGSDYMLQALTDYKKARDFDSPIYWSNYGVSDNASQVLDYYEYLLTEYGEYMKNRKFVILMTPIFREDQPEDGGWRWHKWGPYIGDFESKCEYLYDEQGIDYVWVFDIVEVKECDKEETK